MNPFAAIGVAVIGLLALIFRPRPSSRTPWTGQGLPAPVADLGELYTLARGVVDNRRLTGAFDRGQITLFQRRAALTTPYAMQPEYVAAYASEYQRATGDVLTPAALADTMSHAGATGIYDPRTRQAVGYYGRFWQEETP